MKNIWKKVLSVLLVMAMLVEVHGQKAEAKTLTANRPINMYCDGRYVYYTGDDSEPPAVGLMRLDTKTGKVKKIHGEKYHGEDTNGFRQVCVKGKYIYFTWDRKYGSDCEETYIYRVKKNGKGMKKLSIGKTPVIVGNRVYYTKCKKLYNDYFGYYTKESGMASMKLDGSDKRKESKVKFSWKKTSPDYGDGEWGKGERTATTGNNYYYTEKNRKILKCINLKNGKAKTLYRCKEKEEIVEIMAHKDAVIAKVYVEEQQYNCKKIYMDSKGKKKVLLRKTAFVN